jgi:hypothetical protein
MLRPLFGLSKAQKRVPPKLKPPVPPPPGEKNASDTGMITCDAGTSQEILGFKDALVWILDAEEVLKTHRKNIPEGEMLLKRLHGGKWWSDLLKKY